MTSKDPTAELADEFSSPGATPTKWADGSERLKKAEIYWLSTVRPDARPHVTPLIGLFLDEAFHFCTGPTERKAKNLAANPHVVVTTGDNAIDKGMDLVVEGDALRVTDGADLQRVADEYAAKYDWQFTARDGAFFNDQGGEAFVFRVVPSKAFAFGKGEPFSQTRWRF
jgi:general stress protein 26